MKEAEQAVIIDPEEPATASVIWLHGLGADGYDFAPLVRELDGQLLRTTRFVFPHAPRRPVTINGGYVMRAWYDVLDMDLTRRPDEAGIRSSAATLRGYVAQESERGVPTGRIVLAGFSQGGAVALHAAVRHPARIAGVLALSTYLPLPESTAQEAAPANRDTPMFMAHGEHDPVIPLQHAETSRDFLRRLGYRIEWHCYPMPHAVCPQEIVDISAWLRTCLA